MKRLLLAGVLLAACTGGDGGSTLLPPTTALVPDVSTTTTEPPPTVVACDPAAFVPTVLPDRVADDRPATRDVPFDMYTIISGTSTSVWSQEDGTPVVGLIRGSLPPVQWLETPERITVREVDAALGQLPDGVWGVAWFEGPDRCDEYTIVLYPPATAAELQSIAESLVEGERQP
ncbi:MAG: hypothetical protein KJO17_00470 [Acidimicrobiia bacterium]|nr:hypothetical protein [Acidimicrobiia bacterium]